jgi:hypothetical protein
MGKLHALRLSAAGFMVVVGVGIGVQAAPVAGQFNDFESGTTQGWGVGINVNNTVNMLGGPAGAEDNYIRVTSTGGGGPGSRLITLNESAQWTGNFLTAQIGAVEMDLKNFGTTPLSMRIGLRNPSNSEGLASAAPFTLPADGQWHHVVFPLSGGAMTPGGSYSTVMSNAADFRILHGTNTDHRGETIAGSFGVDNVRTILVPEPSLGLLAAAPTLLLLLRRRRRA